MPLALTPLLGREAELAAVREMVLRSDVRLVTLTGTGGVGKTRLALEAAADLRAEFTDGVRFVELAPVRYPELVVPVVAQALGIVETGGRTALQALETALRPRHLLLVLDNAEHVPEVGPIVVHLLSQCPGLRVLITSRRPLRVSGEHLFPVAPLPVGSAMRGRTSVRDVSTSPATALFVQRAQQVQPDFALTEANWAQVAKVCHLLDGLPLAIELAAVWVRTLSVAELVKRLRPRLDLLTGGARDHHPRHHTMRDTIAWSYQLLDHGDQAAFRQLSLFAGGFTLASAKAVLLPETSEATAMAGEGSAQRQDVALLERLARLVDASLVRVIEDVDGQHRFVMFETVREFAHERLMVTGEADELQGRHAAHFLTYVEELQPCFFGAWESAALDLVEREYDNIRAALDWAVDRCEAEIALRFTRVLWHLWFVRGYLSEGRTWGERVLALSSTRCAVFPEVRGEVRFATAWITLLQGNRLRASELADEALAVAREDGSEFGEALAMFVRGLVAQDRGDTTEAIARYDRALVLARRLGYPSLIGYVLVHLGTATRATGRVQEARALLEDALALRRPSGNKVAISHCLTALGDAVASLGEAEEAERLHREAFALRWQDANRLGMAESLRKLAGLLSITAEADRAARLLSAGESLRKVLGAPLVGTDRQEHDRVVGAVRSAIGDTALADALKSGETLSLTRVVAEALASTSTPRQPGPKVSAKGLTLRELEVLRLIADGSSDKEIAEALFISRRTVTSYVTNILTKLDLRSRSAAAAYAVRHGLA